jgi:glycosyltransferase involved in cell wall biosynthesis
VIRSDPFTKSLLARTDIVCVINDSLAEASQIRHRSPIFTPPPLDSDQFHPDGPDVREKYGLSSDTVLITAIGKLSKKRGFELVLQTFSGIQETMANTRLMIIGHGERRPALEAMARELGIAAKVIWAGYHEDDLADHYRAADFLLFVEKGSDEGHSAVIESMACGTVPITAPLPGMRAILGSLGDFLIAEEGTAESLQSCLRSRVNILDQLRDRVVERSSEFNYSRAARRLKAAYSQTL